MFFYFLLRGMRIFTRVVFRCLYIIGNVDRAN